MKKIGLCEGRHNVPVDEYIFPHHFFKEFSSMFDWQRSWNRVDEVLKDVKELEVYVTGLTPALTVVMDWCFCHKVKLTLLHFDKLKNKYVRQGTHCNCREEFVCM